MIGHATSINDVQLIDLRRIKTGVGNLVVYPDDATSDFAVKRIYYLYDIPAGSERGGHAHYELEQIIVAVAGAFEITLDDGREQATYLLHQPHLGLRLPPGLWRTLQNFSGGAVCLVIASERYNEADYIRDYATFKTWKTSSHEQRF